MRVLSFNIHKGFSSSNLEFVLPKLQPALQRLGVDLLLLQEVVGENARHRARHPGWPEGSQVEYLAEQIWPHFAYGKNAVYSDGHHGNAVLSKHPIVFWENQDVSFGRLEQRGLLHAAVKSPEFALPLHVICVHLSLFEARREAQLNALIARVRKVVPPSAPLLIGGDFNDWRGRADEQLRRGLGMVECFRASEGENARSFPSWLPLLRLDRIYARHLRCRRSRVLSGAPWTGLSDHLPLEAELEA